MIEKWTRFARFAFSIRKGTDIQGTIDEIDANVTVKGANIWLLICSAILASIGLDLNSTAVIIGAMLISPLMSPILGVGLGIAILDRPLIVRAFGNLIFATIISLITSFAYFWITPLGELTTELNARTMPTILEVGVAFFGGIAGIVANSREKKTSAIPGVAIATALMPPLCTAGFGLAKFDAAVILGAFYLFVLNAFFISLATYVVAVWLKFPRKAEIENEQQIRVKRLIIAFALLVSIPSGIIFIQVLSKLRFDRGVQNFVNKQVSNSRRQSVRWEVLDEDGGQTLRVFTVGDEIGSAESEELRSKLTEYGIGELGLKVIPMNVSVEEFRKTTSGLRSNMTERLLALEAQAENSRRELESQRKELKRLHDLTDPYIKFASLLKKETPEIEEVFWSEPYPEDGSPSSIPSILNLRFAPAVDENSIDEKAGLLRRRMESEFPGLHFEIRVLHTEDPQ